MIESLISDLAYILVLAAIVTLLFKRIRQPIVLGYIVAGFLASPNFIWLPSLAHAENIDFWAELGVIVLLFSLGLEFSFKKLMSCGGAAVITCLVCILGLMFFGFCIGHIMGFSSINSIFLGGMISVASTTIILKALNDLGMRHRKFAPKVLGVLIVEDLFAVLMMVILSSVAVGSVAGGEMLFAMAKLVFFLVLWFVVGTYVLPTFFNRVRKLLTDETLLIISMALCLGMAFLAVECGFSLALGAFVMGSILAGTTYAERIEHIVEPVKNLFGAVFFISVGMMVNPMVIIDCWQPILVIACAVVVGGIFWGTTGMLISGQTLRIAIQSGFTLTQIGEFSFIIASLGMSLGVLDPVIYPIIVAVSVLTTFTTPFFMKMSTPAYEWIERHLPQRLRFLIDRYSEDGSQVTEVRSLWTSVLKRYAWRVLLYTVVLVAISLLFSNFASPIILKMVPGAWGNLFSCLLTLVAMLPFLLGLTLPASKKWERQRLTEVNSRFDIPLMVMTLGRLVICVGFIVFVVSAHYGMLLGLFSGITAVVLWVLFSSQNMRSNLGQIEKKFINNLNERELQRSGANNNLVNDIHLAHGTVGYDCPFLGDRLSISNIGQKHGVNLVSIQRGGKIIPVPGPDERLFPGDLVGIVGTEQQILDVMPLIEQGSDHVAESAKEDVKLTHLVLSATSPLIGKTLAKSHLRSKDHALLVALLRDEQYVPLTPDLTFQASDMLWLVAQPSALSNL